MKTRSEGDNCDRSGEARGKDERTALCPTFTTSVSLMGNTCHRHSKSIACKIVMLRRNKGDLPNFMYFEIPE
ncbi:hypothetical protein ZWY2020_051259 [Hordeum vulgare]|nr:hypothetical protein ZWY2020_051259 [Hordeum vulgare]